MSHKREPYSRLGLTALVLVGLALGTAPLAGAPMDAPPGSTTSATIGPNLLENPYFDLGGFYFRFPNSLVPPMWYRWHVTPGAVIPEFIDGGTIYHNACYPEPPPGGLCVDMVPKNRSLGYIKYGGTYVAGVWQPVPATPCLDYQFAGYVRTDDQGYRPKLGIDPTGWRMPPKNNPNPDLDYNCPPDGHTLCPKESFAYESDMPSSIVWSAPIYDPAPPPIVWRGPAVVTAEAMSTTITVWTFAAPTMPGSQSTYWDFMSLFQVTKQTLLPDGRIPQPDGTLTPTVVPGTTTAQINWTTSQPALDQVFYRLHQPVSSCVGTECICPGTSCVLYPAYLPTVMRAPLTVGDFSFKTEPTNVLATNHSATLTELSSGVAYDYFVVSRGFAGGACVSSVSAMGTFTTTP